MNINGENSVSLGILTLMDSNFTENLSDIFYDRFWYDCGTNICFYKIVETATVLVVIHKMRCCSFHNFEGKQFFQNHTKIYPITYQ